MKRWLATVSKSNEEGVRRLILGQGEHGWFLFLSRAENDEGCFADEWYETRDDAVEVATETYGVHPAEWKQIPETQSGCQDDWIRPVRRAGEVTAGAARLEELVDGVWRPLLTGSSPS